MEARLPIRILSDLHLAHPATKVKNVWQLQPLLAGMRTVVFNGDTVEMRMDGILPTAMRYRDTLLTLCRENGVDPILLNGNHDPSVAGSEYFELKSHGLLVTHGDALFPGITPWNRDTGRLKNAHERALEDARAEGPLTLGRRLEACRKASMVHSSMLKPQEKRIHWMGHMARDLIALRRLFAIFHSWTVAPTRASMLAETFRPDYRFIAIGHTHWPGVWRRRGRVIFNTGAYFPWPGQGIVEVHEDEIIFRKVKARANSFYPGRIVKRFPVTG